MLHGLSISFKRKSQRHYVGLEGSTRSFPCYLSDHIPFLFLHSFIRDPLASSYEEESMGHASFSRPLKSYSRCPAYSSPESHVACPFPTTAFSLKGLLHGHLIETAIPAHTFPSLFVCFPFLLDTYYYVACYLFYLLSFIISCFFWSNL